MRSLRRASSRLVPYRLTICGIDEIPDHLDRGVTHALSILDPDTATPLALAGFINLEAHTLLRFDDVTAPMGDAVPPGPDDIAEILAFGGRLASADPGSHALVHCHAGVSRSSAAAAILLAAANPGREGEAMRAVRRLRPGAWPNRLMITIADRLLQRDGALLEALRVHFETRWIWPLARMRRHMTRHL